MFCPKCGTQNPDDGKFCRTCGLDISNVTALVSTSKPNFMSGLEKSLSRLGSDMGCDDSDDEKQNIVRRSDPSEVYGDGIKNLISGLGFMVVSAALFFTNVAGGRVWFWALLFPAFAYLSKGIADLLKSRKMIQDRNAFYGFSADGRTRALHQHSGNTALPPTQTNYVPPSDMSYKTGDLAPTSVTDNTTKLLELDRENETKAL